MSVAPTRILHVSHSALVSGAEHSLLDLLTGLDPLADIRLVAPAGDLLERARHLGIETSQMRNVGLTFKTDRRAAARALRDGGAAARTLSRELGGRHVVHANSVRAALLCAPVARVRRVPLVMHVRDVLPDNAAGRAVRLATARLSTRIAAISQHVADAFCHELPASLTSRVTVVDNPLDVDRFAPRDATSRRDGRRALGITDERPALAIVGQITAWKGHDVALRTLAGVRTRHPDAVLLVVGEVKFASGATLDNTAFRRELDVLAADLALPAGAVRYLGERDDIPRVLAATDLLLAPSTVEPFGRSIAEAMSVGVPVLATSAGGPAEFVDDDRTGWLLDPRDPSRWSERAMALLDRPSRMTEVGCAASAAIRSRFSRDRHARVMLTLLEAAMAARPSRRHLV